MSELVNKIRRRWMKLRLQPIRVFCFHQVSDELDETTMKQGDWLPTDRFKRAIRKLQDEGYAFITLLEAHEKLKCDIFRFCKYVVLTADDGWASLKNVLPWLSEQKIPITLFLNPAYLDGKHFRERDIEKYLSGEDIKEICNEYPLVTIGSHGWEHIDTTKQTDDEFAKSVVTANDSLKSIPNFIPFYAFTWGRYSLIALEIVKQRNLIPVLMDGMKNYTDETIIHRELLK